MDIVAADSDDLLAWKGWVESRFRQLTLKVKFFVLVNFYFVNLYGVYSLLSFVHIYGISDS